MSQGKLPKDAIFAISSSPPMQEAMPTKALAAMKKDQPMTLGDLASAPAINIQDDTA